MRLFAIFFAAAACLAARTQPDEAAPASLIIQYRCPVSTRAELRASMQSEGIAEFEQWKSRGRITSYHLLFSRYVDNNNWDMMAVLNFRNYEEVARWKEVEARHPAGLPPKALASVLSVSSYPVDLVRTSEPHVAPAAPAYLVIPYSLAADPDVYLQYFDDALRPQLAGWRQEGILAGFSLYMQRYAAARPWDITLVLEYADDAALDRREAVAAKVRQQLQNDPKWKSAADNAQRVATEKEAIVADEISAIR